MNYLKDSMKTTSEIEVRLKELELERKRQGKVARFKKGLKEERTARMRVEDKKPGCEPKPRLGGELQSVNSPPPPPGTNLCSWNITEHGRGGRPEEAKESQPTNPKKRRGRWLAVSQVNLES